MRTDTALLVIAKSPEPGKVKTRLSPPCSPEQAAALAAAALEDTLAAVSAAGGPDRRRILVLDGPAGPWTPEAFEVIVQRGDGLAERLANAFADAGAPAMLVGMDTPQLEVAQLEAGLAALDREDVQAVYGPATDGGYWAIGLRTADPRVFEDVEMSTQATGAHQLARLRALRLSVAELPPLLDVDTIEDARVVAADAPASRFAAELSSVERMLEGAAVA
ncbi:MAG: TIGR04282 family arsenosugar biosynthesis glycosyltransferase [Solirubrobacterales bacterium]|nr:TIGR04282 family arsenosugar biosynthesis glycosyltransferase [Solirubrobacterales bacterium]